VHSHAGGQNLPVAIFADRGGEMYRKRASHDRIALKTPAGVRRRDVMFNTNGATEMKKPPMGGFFI